VPTPARRLALDVLSRARPGGATLADALAAPEVDALPSTERALLHELVLGTLRRRGWLDHVLQRLTERPLAKTSPVLLDVLRLGTYQLLFLRVPDHAAVSESVSLARAAEPGGAGFVNAVLRRLQREGPPAEPDEDDDPLAWLTTAGSLPRWLAARWLERHGASETIARARALLEPPAVHVHLNPRRPDAAARAEAAGVVLAGTDVPGAWEVVRGRPGPLAAEGLLHVQDKGSQLVALLAARAGVVLDGCAAPGGKSLLLSDRSGPGGLVVASDVSARRLRTLVDARARWGASRLVVVVADGRTPPFRGGFDSVLLDAPCTGLGTLARHPDIRWRARPADPGRHRERQRLLLDAAGSLVRPGGRLVYATCSVEDEETTEVVQPFLERHPAIEPETLPEWARPYASGPFVRMSPARERGDAFFAAVLARR